MHREEKKRRRSLFPILLTYFLDNFGLAIIFPIFTPLFLTAQHPLLQPAASYFEKTFVLGLLIGAFPLAQFFGAPLIGQFSDRYGRKRAFYITITGLGLCYACTGLSILGNSVLGLFLSRFASGIFAGNLTLCFAAIADMSHDEVARAKNFGFISAMGGLSFLLAIALGGVLSDSSISPLFSPSFPFWLTSFLSYVNLACVFFFFHETHPVSKTPGFHIFKGFHNVILGLKSKELRHIYAANFFYMLGWVSAMQFLPTFLLEYLHLSQSQMIFFLIIVGVVWALANMIINRILAERFFAGKTYLICLLFLSILLLDILFAQSSMEFAALFYPAACFSALCWTNSAAIVSLKAPAAIQGSILGINQSTNAIAYMLAPALGGAFAGFNIHANYLFAGFSIFLSFCILWYYKAYRHTHIF